MQATIMANQLGQGISIKVPLGHAVTLIVYLRICVVHAQNMATPECLHTDPHDHVSPKVGFSDATSDVKQARPQRSNGADDEETRPCENAPR